MKSALKAVGSEHEKSSPFFIRNKQKCEDFQGKMEAIGAEVRGSYGAWAYLAVANFKDEPKTKAAIERKTDSRSDLLDMRVSEICEWKIHSKRLHFDTQIRRRRALQIFIPRHYLSLKSNKAYLIKREFSQHSLLKEIVGILSPLFSKNLIFHFEIEEHVLTIRFKYENSLHLKQLQAIRSVIGF